LKTLWTESAWLQQESIAQIKTEYTWPLQQRD